MPFRTVRCPNCFHSEEIDEIHIQPRTKTARCRKCGHEFAFSLRPNTDLPKKQSDSIEAPVSDISESTSKPKPPQAVKTTTAMESALPTKALTKRANMQNLYEAILGEKNRIYYLTTFEQFDQQGLGLKASWNWPAFLCGGAWALYRKMYGWFFAFWGVAALSNIFKKAGSPGLGAIIFLVPWIAFTIYANSLYHNSVKKKIAIAQLTVKDESKLHELLRYKGGVHTWAIWVFGLGPVIGVAILILMFARH